MSAVYLLGFIFLLFALWIPETFLTQTTFKLVFADQVVVAILGLALLIPLTAGAFDLSVGAMLAFSLVIVSWFEAEHRHAGGRVLPDRHRSPAPPSGSCPD